MHTCTSRTSHPPVLPRKSPEAASLKATSRTPRAAICISIDTHAMQGPRLYAHGACGAALLADRHAFTLADAWGASPHGVLHTYRYRCTSYIRTVGLRRRRSEFQTTLRIAPSRRGSHDSSENYTQVVVLSLTGVFSCVLTS